MTTLALIPRGMRGRTILGFLGGCLLSLLAAVPASAFQIVPISQDFDPSGRGANQTFQVENDRQEAVTVTIAMAKRVVDKDGKETLEPTEDFTLFPTEIVLQPKTSRIVRAKWIGDPSPKAELAYRIIAEETPLNMRRETPGASVFLTIRYVGSIYVVPKGVKPDVVVASAQPAGGAARAAAREQGVAPRHPGCAVGHGRRRQRQPDARQGRRREGVERGEHPGAIPAPDRPSLACRRPGRRGQGRAEIRPPIGGRDGGDEGGGAASSPPTVLISAPAARAGTRLPRGSTTGSESRN